MNGLKSLLSQVPLYVGLQKAVGADLLRYHCLDAAQLRPGQVVVDVGCGPAYYFDRLPQPLDYYGFDTDEVYINWSKRRFGQRGTFHLGAFDAAAAKDLPAPDVILMLGLLHHVDDATAVALLELTSSVLAPGGRVVSADPTFTPEMSRLSRWMSNNDRGEHVRHPGDFEAIARPHFDGVEAKILPQRGRTLGTNLLMIMSKAPAVQPASHVS